MNCCNIHGNPLLWFFLFVVISCHIYRGVIYRGVIYIRVSYISGCHIYRGVSWGVSYAYFDSVNIHFMIEAILLMRFELLLCNWVNYDCGA